MCVVYIITCLMCVHVCMHVCVHVHVCNECEREGGGERMYLHVCVDVVLHV